MDKKELYEIIKDRKMSNLFGDLEYQLELTSPNSATIHKFGNLRQYFSSAKRMYENNYFPTNETVTQFKKRDASLFEESMEHILESIKFFNVHV